VVSILPRIFSSTTDDKNLSFENQLINQESLIGAQLFGPIPQGHHRQFFCLDEFTWIWFEEWVESGSKRSVTTRYEVRQNGVVKVQDGQTAVWLEGKEARNFLHATRKYYEIMHERYSQALAA
jgi:hypothetical protein